MNESLNRKSPDQWVFYCPSSKYVAALIILLSVLIFLLAFYGVGVIVGKYL